MNVINIKGNEAEIEVDGKTHFVPFVHLGNKVQFVYEGEIYTVHPDGSHLSAITTGGPGFDQPAWSPDGSQLAMVAATNGNTMIGAPLQIDVANADGTDLHAVSPPGWSSYNPTWTPDGRIVFLVDDGGTDAYSINADGTDLRQLYGNLGGPERVWQITWGSRPLTPAKCGS